MARLRYIVACKECGRRIRRPNQRAFLCSGCKEGGYPRAYYKNRKIAFKRDDFSCQSCGVKEHVDKSKRLMTNKLLAHHIDTDRKNNSPSNLITLCVQCHAWLHRKYTDKELREGNIYKMFPQEFRWGQFGKRLGERPAQEVKGIREKVKERIQRFLNRTENEEEDTHKFSNIEE